MSSVNVLRRSSLSGFYALLNDHGDSALRRNFGTEGLEPSLLREMLTSSVRNELSFLDPQTCPFRSVHCIFQLALTCQGSAYCSLNSV